MNTRIQTRIGVAARSLIKDKSIGSGRRYRSGTELVAVVELPSGPAQFHLTLVTNKSEFMDVDKPTGCADDLIVAMEDFDA